MSIISDESMDRLIAHGSLKGKIEILNQLKFWLNVQLAEVERESDRQAEEAKVIDERNANGRTDILGEQNAERAS